MYPKYTLKSAMLFFAFAIFHFSGYAQSAIGTWVNTGPVKFPVNSSGQVNGLGRVSQLKFHPSKKDVMYAVSASGGLYITKDNGLNWVNTIGTETFPRTSLSSVCIDYTNDSIIYLSSGDADYYGNGYGIYKTTDAGTTWNTVTTGIGNKMAVEILMDTTDHNTLVAATSSGIWKTTNAGTSWSQTYTGGTFRDMKARPLSKKVLYAATGTQFFRSTDFGSNWTQITSGLSFPSGNSGIRIGVSPDDTNVVYLLTTGGNGVVFKSINGGTTFSTVYSSSSQCLVCYDAAAGSGSQGNYNIDINVNPENADEILTVAHNVWRSIDGGVTWDKRTSWYDECHTDMHQIDWNPYDNTQTFNSNDGGVWMSTDTTAKVWVPRCDGVAACEIYQAAQSPITRQVVSIGTQDNGELFYDGDWKTSRGGDWTSKCVFDYATASTVYYLGNGKRRSLVPLGAEVNYNTPFTATNSSDMEFVPTIKNVCFLGKTDIWRSNNIDGASPTWTRILTASDQVLEMASCRADTNILYMVTNNGKILRSDNALAATPTFTTYSTPASTAAGGSVATNKNNANIVYLSCGSGIYRSSDKGATWTNITGTGLSGLNIRKILHDDFSSNERLFVYASNYVHSKTSAASAWTNYSAGLPSICNGKNLMIYNTGDAASVLRISTYGRGVWECAINNDLKPKVGFSSNKKVICVGDTVRFYKSVYGLHSTTAWTFPGGTPSSSTADSPVVVYFTKGLYDVSCAVTGTTGGDTLTKTAYIEVGSRPVALLAEGFEGATFPPAQWRLETESGGQWEQTDDASGFSASTNCIMFDNNGINGNGKHDRIITPTIALKSISKATMTFEVAYQPYSAAYPDSLIVSLSADCGKTWTPIWDKSGTTLATSTAAAIYYRWTPSASKWRKETIDLAPYKGMDVLVAFENVGYYGQALFIDNVNIDMTPAVDFEADKDTICSGQSVTFYDSTLNATSIDWTFPGGFPSTATAKVVTISYPSPGAYPVTLVATNALGTSSFTKTAYVIVRPNPSIFITALGGTLTAVGSSAITWQWYRNGILIPGATAATYMPSLAGDYTVAVTDANGCANTSSIFPYIPNGINDVFRSAGYQLYPNPTKASTTLQGTGIAGSSIQVSIINVLGQVVMANNIPLVNGSFVHQYDCSPLAKGIYEVRITATGARPLSSKLIIE